MPALSQRKLEIVRTLVDTAPDAVVEGLRQALAAAGGDAALASVRQLVELEAGDRQLRNVSLAPLLPICVGDGADPLRLTFPARVPGLLWRALKAQAPAFVRNAEVALYGGETSADPYDRLLRIAAKGIRAAETREFQAVRQACDAARPVGAEALLAALDVAPVVRRISLKLSGWVSHQTAEASAAARLAYKDAVAAAPDAGTIFFHMLAAQLPKPYTVLRIISAVMEKPTERYLAESELGVFGEIVLRDVEQALAAVAGLDPDGGAEAARAAAAQVNRVTGAGAELETYVTLSREQGWGKQLLKLRASLSALVEERCDEAETLFGQALPSSRGGAKRARRSDAQPDPVAVRRCLTLLAFVSELRASANPAGFAAARSRLFETLGQELDLAVEHLVEAVKAGDAAAQAHLAVAADLSALVRDEKAGELVRRRAAAAAAPPPVDPVKSLLAGT